MFIVSQPQLISSLFSLPQIPNGIQILPCPWTILRWYLGWQNSIRRGHPKTMFPWDSCLSFCPDSSHISKSVFHLPLLTCKIFCSLSKNYNKKKNIFDFKTQNHLIWPSFPILGDATIIWELLLLVCFAPCLLLSFLDLFINTVLPELITISLD